MNGRLAGGPFEWLVEKLQGRERQTWTQKERKCKSNWKMGVVATFKSADDQFETPWCRENKGEGWQRNGCMSFNNCCTNACTCVSVMRCVAMHIFLRFNKQPGTTCETSRCFILGTNSLCNYVDEVEIKKNESSLPVNQVLLYLDCGIWLFPKFVCQKSISATTWLSCWSEAMFSVFL